jgi:hypothetical protein
MSDFFSHTRVVCGLFAGAMPVLRVFCAAMGCEATGISVLTRPCLREVTCVEELAALLGELSVYGVLELLTLEPAELVAADHKLAVPELSHVQVYEVSSVLYGRLRRTVSRINVKRPEVAWNIMCKCAPDTVCCLGAFDGWLQDAHDLRDADAAVTLTVKPGARGGDKSPRTVSVPCRMDDTVVQLRARICAQLGIKPWSGTLYTGTGEELVPSRALRHLPPKTWHATLGALHVHAGDSLVLQLHTRWQVFVHGVVGGTYTVKLGVRCTPATLHKTVAALTNVTAAEQRLVWRGCSLQPDMHDRTLTELGLHDMSVIHQVMRLRGGMHHPSALVKSGAQDVHVRVFKVDPVHQGPMSAFAGFECDDFVGRPTVHETRAIKVQGMPTNFADLVRLVERRNASHSSTEEDEEEEEAEEAEEEEDAEEEEEEEKDQVVRRDSPPVNGACQEPPPTAQQVGGPGQQDGRLGEPSRSLIWKVALDIVDKWPEEDRADWHKVRRVLDTLNLSADGQSDADFQAEYVRIRSSQVVPETPGATCQCMVM